MLAMLALACAPMFAASPAPAPVYQAQVMNPDLVGGRFVANSGAGTFLIWGSDATILISANGRDWQHAQTPGSSDIAQLAANIQGSVLVAVGARGSILRSTDAGKSWRTARHNIATDLLAVVHAGARVWIAAGAQGRILRSTDDARTWSLVDSHLEATMRVMSIDPASGRILIGGDDGLVGFSDDAGESWQLTALTMPHPVTAVTGFHRLGKLLLATSALGRFLTSEDNGSRWDLMQSSTQASFIDVTLDSERGVIVLASHNGDLLRSSDGGRSWEGNEVMVDGRRIFLNFLHHDASNKALLAIGQAGHVASSTDGGINWTTATQAGSSELTGQLGGALRGLLRDPGGALIVFGDGGLMAASTDSGVTWTSARPRTWHAIPSGSDGEMRQTMQEPGSGHLLKVGDQGTLLRSSDGGRRWAKIDTHTSRHLSGMAADPISGDLVLAGERLVRLVRQSPPRQPRRQQ